MKSFELPAIGAPIPSGDMNLLIVTYLSQLVAKGFFFLLFQALIFFFFFFKIYIEWQQ